MFASQLRLLLLSIALCQTIAGPLTTNDVEKHIEKLKGDDHRMVRWNADENTARHQKTECGNLAKALDLFKSSKEVKVRATVAEYATFCITDNPENRAILSNVEGIHAAILELVREKDPKASSIGAHLVYISAYNNAKNIKEFFDEDAVPMLAELFMNHEAESSQHMWAAAAIQNLAASYCEDECHWHWTKANKFQHVVLDESNSKLVIDGSPVRQEILRYQDLSMALSHMACMGPVMGKEDPEDNPFPGETAKKGKHDNHYNIVAWAAAGALKNIALEPHARNWLEAAVGCACHMEHSEDWLEAAKAESFLDHMRPDNPCYFMNEETDEIMHNKDYEEGDEDTLCWDYFFVNSDGQLCGDFSSSKDKGCETRDAKSSLAAQYACCACGGGNRDVDYDEHFEEDDEFEGEEF